MCNKIAFLASKIRKRFSNAQVVKVNISNFHVYTICGSQNTQLPFNSTPLRTKPTHLDYAANSRALTHRKTNRSTPHKHTSVKHMIFFNPQWFALHYWNDECT
jgi:hypothetical protein